jgi:hypothetical protein
VLHALSIPTASLNNQLQKSPSSADIFEVYNPVERARGSVVG